MAVRDQLAKANGQIVTPLVRNSGRVAGGLFSALGSWRDEDVEKYLAQVTPVLKGAKKKAAESTIAFYQSVAKVTGQPFNKPVILASDLATKTLRNGVDSLSVYRRPFVSMRMSLAKGLSVTDSIKAGATRANQLAQTEVELARRQSGLRVRQANQNIVGYIRTLTGSENCALCYVASTQRYRKGDLMPIHPGCDCGEMPLYGTDDPGQIIDQQRLDATHENVLKRFGESDKSARSIDYRNIMVSNHGEMGPTLTWKKHNSALLANLKTPVAPAIIDNPSVSVAKKVEATKTTKELTRKRGSTTLVGAEYTTDELGSVRAYTGNDYYAMNKYMRGQWTEEGIKSSKLAPGETFEDFLSSIDGVKSAISRTRLTSAKTLYRGVDQNAYGLDKFNDFSVYKDAMVGTVLEEPAFFSTSSRVSGSFTKQINLKIKAPAGTQAIDINKMNPDRSMGIINEAEIVLAPNTRFVIEEVTNATKFSADITVRVLKEGEMP